MAIIQIDPPIIAHRGASAYAPENTLSAFEKAADLGVKWVEFDVMQAACGEPVIFHDESLERTTNGQGLIRKYPFSYLSQLDAGKWFDPKFMNERILSLRQVLDFLNKANLSANVELKPPKGSEEELVQRVLNELRPFLASSNINILFSSFSLKALTHLRKLNSECQIGLLLHRWKKNWQEIADRLKCASVHVNEKIMTEEIASKIKKTDRLLLCYTVNCEERALKLFSWGVDGIFTDAPDRMLRIL